MSRSFEILVFIGLCLVQCINSQGYYTIVGSKTIRPNSEYRVSVNSHHDAESTILVSLRCTNHLSQQYYQSRYQYISPFRTLFVTFNIGNVNLKNCKLEAQGYRGIIFRNSTEVEFNGKAFSIYVQTDKAIYKQNDKVQFRVILLDSNLLPAKHNNQLNIMIIDANNNNIKQWNNQATKNGVFSNVFELAEYPIFGEWKINVTIMDMVYVKAFDVDSYVVLPHFEVSIDTKRHSTLYYGKITGTLLSKYTFGKFVEGNVTLTAYATSFIGSKDQLNPNVTYELRTTTLGKHLFNIDLLKDLGINNNNNNNELDVIIKATVDEKLTGRTQTITTVVSLHTTKYLIDFISDASSIKPGLPYTTWIKVTDYNGAPPKELQNDVTVEYSFGEHSTSRKVLLDVNGMSKIIFDSKDIPNSIVARYYNASGYYYLPRKLSSENSYIQATVKTLEPTLDAPLHIEINSTESMHYFTYQVIAKGKILLSDTIYVFGRKFYLLKFTPTFAMVPKAKLLVYFVNANGQIVADVVDIKFPSLFLNNVKLDLSKQKLRPKKSVDISIRARPNSYVGVLGVDQSVLLLKNGNDLDIDDILGDLASYENQPTGNSGQFPDFHGAGVVIMTNAKQSIGTREIMDGLVPSFDDSDIVVRKHFPEIWLWDTIENNGATGLTTLKKQVPETITSWIITAFAIDPVYGFGMLPSPKKLEVFQPLFITTYLPYSVKQGEIVKIPVVVFNYIAEEMIVEVELNNELLEFEFVEGTNQSIPGRVQKSLTKEVVCAEVSGTSLYFKIRPLKNGYIKIKITARSYMYDDAIEKLLLVEPEGVTVYVDKNILIDLRETSELIKNLTIEIPTDVVPDSTRIQITVYGDILTQTLNNLNHLIRLPVGSSEEIMTKLAPNIVVLNYLKLTGQLTPYYETLIKNYIVYGYQNILRYKLNSGAFDYWTYLNYSNGSTWLTAYVTRTLIQAEKHVYINPDIITAALRKLSEQQEIDGTFTQVGSIVWQQRISTTAYILLTFIESPVYGKNYKPVVNKALDYIAKNIQNQTDVYAIAISTYVLHLANHTSKTYALELLRSKATVKNGDKYFTLSGYSTGNVEITGYALMSYVLGNLLNESAPIVSWMVSRYTNRGAYLSTQETVVGLQALTMHPFTNYNVKIIARYNLNDEQIFNVNKTNAMMLQSSPLPPSIRDININSTGSGVAVAQLSYKYNINGDISKPRFTLNTTINTNSTANYLHLTVCTSYIPEGNDTRTNMAILEVQLPSGYYVNKIFPNVNVRRSEMENDNTLVVFYFESLNSQLVCPSLEASRTIEIENLKSAPVIVYDYYNNARRARIFYKV